MPKAIDSISLYDVDRTTALALPAGEDLRTMCEVEQTDRLGETGKLVLRFVAPFTSTVAEDYFTKRRIIRLDYDDGSFREYRIRRFQTEYAGSELPQVEAEAIDVDLASVVARRTLTGGYVDHAVLLSGMTAQEALDEIFDTWGAPAYFQAGTVEAALASAEVLVAAYGETPLGLLSALCDSIRSRTGLTAEWEIEWNASDSKYDVHIYREVGWTAAERTAGTADATLRPVVDANHDTYPPARLQNQRTITAEGFFSRVVPLSESDTEQVGIGDAYFTVAAAGSTITLPAGVLFADGQPGDGLYFGNATAGWFPVTASDASAATLTVTGDASALDGEEARFATDGAGTQLTYIEDPDSVGASGVVEEIYRRSDIPPFQNLLERAGVTPDFSDWSGGLPVGTAAVGSPTISESTDGRYVKNGTKSARLQADADEGISADLNLPVTSAQPYVSIDVALRVPSGKVRVELEDSSGEVFDADESGRQPASSSDQVVSLQFSGIKPAAGTATLRVLAVEASTDCYLDAWAVVQSAYAYAYSPEMGPQALWRAAASYLAEKGGEVPDAIEGRTFDAAYLSGSYTEIEVGSHVTVLDAYATTTTESTTETTHLSDSATDTNGTALASHSPEMGSWTLVEGAFTIQSNRIEAGVDASTRSTATTTGAADGYIQATVRVPGSTPKYSRLLARYQNLNNFVAAEIVWSTGALSLIKVVGGTRTVLASATVTSAASTDYVMKLVLSGMGAEVWWGGVKHIDEASGVPSPGTLAGIQAERNLLTFDAVTVVGEATTSSTEASHGLDITARVVEVVTLDGPLSGRTLKQFKLSREKKDITGRFGKRATRPVLPGVPGEGRSGEPLILSADYELDLSTGAVTIYWTANDATKAVAWAWDKTSLANVDDSAFGTAIGDLDYSTDQEGSATITGLTVAEDEVAFIKLRPFKTSGPNPAAPATNAGKDYVLIAPRGDDVLIFPNVKRDAYEDAASSTGYFRLIADDPQGLVTAFRSRAAEGRNLRTTDSFGALSHTTTSGVHTTDYETVALVEKHDSFIEIEMQVLGFEDPRYRETFDQDAIPEVAVQYDVVYVPGSRIFKLRLTIHGDVDMGSGYWLIEDQGSAASFAGYINDRHGSFILQDGGVDIEFDADSTWDLTVTPYAEADLGGTTGEAWTDVVKFPSDDVAAGRVTGQIIASQLIESAQRYGSDIAFSATDWNTLEWTSGTITLADGTDWNIDAGNTGNMTGGTLYYIYADASGGAPTTLSATTNFAAAIGDDKLLVCVTKAGPDSTQDPFFVPGVGVLGLNGEHLSPNSVSTDTLQANAVTAAKISVVSLSAISADMGSLTAGQIVVGSTNKLWLNDSDDGALAIGGSTKATAPFRVTATGSATLEDATLGNQGAQGTVDIDNGEILIEDPLGNTANVRGALVEVSDATATQNISSISPGQIQVGVSPATVITPTSITVNGSAVALATGSTITNLWADTVDGYHAGNGSGAVPISNGTLNTNLNADKLDGKEAAAFVEHQISTYTGAPGSGVGKTGDLGHDIDLGGIYFKTASGWTEIATAAGSPTSFAGLSDVTITSVANGEIPMYSSGSWINRTLSEAGIAAASHTHAASDVTSGTFADARISASSVTQHQAALSVTSSQVSDFQEAVEDRIGAVITQGNAITVSYSDASGLTTISHADTSSQGSVNNSGHTFIQDITLDAYGHVTAIASAGLSLTTSDLSDFTSTVNTTAWNFTGRPKVTSYLDITKTGLDPSNPAAGVVTLFVDSSANLKLWTESGGSITLWSSANDGSGSLLDADTLDGQHASNFATVFHVHAASDVSSGTFADARIAQSNVTQHQGALTIASTQVSDFTTAVQTVIAATAINADSVDGYHAGNSSSQVAVSNGTVCTNLNADLWDGYNLSVSGLATGDLLEYTGSAFANVAYGHKSALALFATAGAGLAYSVAAFTTAEITTMKRRVDLTGYRKVRLHVTVSSGAGSDGAMDVKYSTTEGGTATQLGSSAVTVTCNAAGVQTTSWIDLAAGAKADIWLRVIPSSVATGYDFTGIWLEFK